MTRRGVEKVSAELASRGYTAREIALAPPPPPTRAGCADLPRPCPALRCQYHLPRSAELVGVSCALDRAEQGPCTLEELGELYSVSKQRAAVVVGDALEAFEREARGVDWTGDVTVADVTEWGRVI